MRGALRALVASQAELEADEERRETERRGCTAVAQLSSRHRAQVSGVLRSVTLRPRQTVPALEAELYDGSGTLRVVWLGRRQIRGIEPGRRARVEGLVCVQDGRPTMYNPRYELSPRPGE
ncbi:MAG TPA: OB-fold nucleic acid binding domain-containing protein [Actinotalea sp.]|nr:OB-fold nucleic acid binding domain-containing protein [Actinotalea sp.]